MTSIATHHALNARRHPADRSATTPAAQLHLSQANFGVTVNSKATTILVPERDDEVVVIAEEPT